MESKSVAAVQLVVGLLMLIECSCTTVSSSSHRTKRLADIVCDAGTTKITPPNYYLHNATDWCASAVGIINNEYFNIDFRTECQRWLGGPLPYSVAAVQLTYCYEFPNATVTYHVGICCNGNVSGLRCFAGSKFGPYVNSYSYHDSMNYRINYENDMETCGVDEVCQSLYTYIGSAGVPRNYTMWKGCAPKNECQAIIDSGNCSNCQVAVPQCAQCCSTAFCNSASPYRGYMRPAVCPTAPTVPTTPKPSTTTRIPTFHACNSNPCQNGGMCQSVMNTTYYYDFVCRCKIGWMGTVCSENRSFCDLDLCLNGGTCYNYSDIAVDNYRCECPLPFVGDRCEMKNNLTIFSSNATYKLTYKTNTNGGCSAKANSARGHPEQFYNPRYSNYMQTVCGRTEPEVAYQILFELHSCRRDDYYTSVDYNSFCAKRSLCNQLPNPCLNGGTCYDWSDAGPGQYRCNCVPSFLGENCEIPNNLTCDSTFATYLAVYPSDNGKSNINCTAMTWAMNGQPGTIVGNAETYCENNVRRPSDGHKFVPGVDGQIKPHIKTQFEVKSCDHGALYSRSNYHMCCATCLSSPCQNGGYCVQLTHDVHVCKCVFGFNGDFCQNRLSVCTVSGDPHFRTFDVKKFSYQGICKYNLANPCSSSQPGLEYFQVLARSENRNNINAVSYPWYVEVIYNGTTVRLANSRTNASIPVKASVNEVAVTVPYKQTDIELQYNGPYVQYVSSFGLSVDFDGSWLIIVNVPGQYSGRMCGMCGNNDNNPNNDLTLANGTYVGDIDLGVNMFGDSWVVDDPEQTDLSVCPAPLPAPPCDTEYSLIYKTYCGHINNSAGVLGPCISRLDPGLADTFYENCMLDACYTNGTSICKSIKTFVEECKTAGVVLPCKAWQSAVNCNGSYSCPVGATYECSVSACQPTCVDRTASEHCGLPNTDKCVCPNGQFLHEDADGLQSCVSTCPAGCADDNMQFQPIGASWARPNCRNVTCEACENCTMGALPVETFNCASDETCRNEKCVPAPPVTPHVTPTRPTKPVTTSVTPTVTPPVNPPVTPTPTTTAKTTTTKHPNNGGGPGNGGGSSGGGSGAESVNVEVSAVLLALATALMSAMNNY